MVTLRIRGVKDVLLPLQILRGRAIVKLGLRGVLVILLLLGRIGKLTGAERLLISLILRRVLECRLRVGLFLHALLFLASLRNRAPSRVVGLLIIG